MNGRIERTSGAVLGRSPRDTEAGNAWFHALIAKNADGILVVGQDGIIIFANPAAETLLGRPYGSLVGTEFGCPIVPGETTEVDVVCSDRAPCVAEMRVVEIEWEGRTAALASLRDISEHKRLEEELNRRVRELAEADQQKNAFLAMLAHELRNPLAPVRNAAEVLRLRPSDPETLGWARELIEQQVEQMTRLVDDLLDVSRITRGKIRLRKEPVLLDRIIARTAEAVRPTIQARGMQLDLDLDAEGLALEADPTRLEQVLTNLLNNAAKFGNAGSRIRVASSLVEGHAEVVVEDEGIGIAPTMIERVFELFAQADHSLDRSRGGLGIGLTLVKSLVEMHGGTVWAESDGIGHGAQFRVRLPVPITALQVRTPARDETPAGTLSRRVLVVDDNLHAAESLSMLLKLWGHESKLAHDGEEALITAGRYCPDVVLLDIGLPRLNGYQVAEKLRETDPGRRILIIAMTGYGLDDDRRRSKQAGIDLHMVKPVDLDELRMKLAQVP